MLLKLQLSCSALRMSDFVRKWKVICSTAVVYAPINLKPAGGGGGGRAWGGDLIVIVGPGVGLLTYLAFPGEGIFESVFAQCGDIEHRRRDLNEET